MIEPSSVAAHLSLRRNRTTLGRNRTTDRDVARSHHDLGQLQRGEDKSKWAHMLPVTIRVPPFVLALSIIACGSGTNGAGRMTSYVASDSDASALDFMLQAAQAWGPADTDVEGRLGYFDGAGARQGRFAFTPSTSEIPRTAEISGDTGEDILLHAKTPIQSLGRVEEFQGLPNVRSATVNCERFSPIDHPTGTGGSLANPPVSCTIYPDPA